jgi:hypothetical protein
LQELLKSVSDTIAERRLAAAVGLRGRAHSAHA